MHLKNHHIKNSSNEVCAGIEHCSSLGLVVLKEHIPGTGSPDQGTYIYSVQTAEGVELMTVNLPNDTYTIEEVV